MKQMISKLKGFVDEISSDAVVVDVGGVGYYLTCSTRTLSKLPPVGEVCVVYVEMVVREDAIMLFGFADVDERQWFRLLTTVQGVGNRVALALLSLADGSTLAKAISTQDKAFIARAEGVGPKLAARLITELKDKVAKMVTFPAAGASVPPGVTFLTPQPFANTAARDAVAALMALGYRSFEANQAIQSVMPENDDQLSVEDLIRLGLAKLGRV